MNSLPLLKTYTALIHTFLLLLLSAIPLQAQPPAIEPIIPIIGPGNLPSINPALINTDFDNSLNEMNKELENRKKDINDKKQEQQKDLDKKEKEKDILIRQRQQQLPEAKIWGQQFFRDQSISLFTRSRDVKALDNYLLDTGDELIIHVWGATEYSCNAVIDIEGYVDISGAELSIPRLYIKGMQFGQAKSAIVARMKNHMRIDKAQYAITLNYARDITVNITGEVFTPGSYTIPASNTVFNALVASEGPSQIGSVRKIQVSSSNKPLRTFDVYKFITDPKATDEFFLTNNDYIYVPLAERVVQINGAVKRPFYYELIEGEHLNALLNYAGGLQADAYQANIKIKRYIGNQEKLININLSDLLAQKEDFNLLNGDIIDIIPIQQAYSNYVKVEGAVKLPGEYELKENTKINDILEKSGIIYSAVMDKIYVKRLRQDLSIEYITINLIDILDNPSHPDNIELRPLDIIEVKYKSQFIDKKNIGIYGAIRNPGTYEFSENLSLEDLLYLSDGIKTEAASSYVEISRLLREKDSTYITIARFPIQEDLTITEAQSFVLQPYDQVFVRQARAFQTPENVTIEGEIRYPGLYTIEKRTETIIELLQRAGGTTEIAFLEGALLYRPNEGYVLLDLRDLVKGNTKSPFNYLLKPGDKIQIPKIKDLVSIAGRVQHPLIREKSEIAEIELQLALKKTTTDIEKEELLAEDKISRKKNPLRINVPFHKGKNAKFYVENYGAGVDRVNGGRKRLIFVRYSNGLVRKTKNFGLFKIYPKVEKGAMVFVEPKVKKVKDYTERKRFDWNAGVQNTIAQLTAVGTLALLITRLL